MKSKMSLCILSDDYPTPNRPAMFVFVEQLVIALVDRGVDVSVIASQSLTKCLIRRLPVLPRKQVYTSPKGQTYHVYRPYSISFGKGRQWLLKVVGAYNQHGVEKCLKEIGPKVLYGHFWHQAYRLKDYANRYQRPLFVACGEGDDAMEQLVASLSRTQKKGLIEAVTGVICVSSENKRKCIEYGLANEKNIVVFPNAVDTDLFHVKPLNLELRHLLHVNDNDILLMFVGHFIPRKGSVILAKAIQMIGDPHVKVIFAGTRFKAEQDPKCDGIVFKGVIPHEMLPDYYACADVFVLPTQGEGCSNAIVEALAMGIPVISSIGSFNDDILNKDNSIRVDPTNVEELIAAIMKMKNDHDFYLELKKKVVSASSNYSISERVDKILSFIKTQSDTYNNP